MRIHRSYVELESSDEVKGGGPFIFFSRIEVSRRTDAQDIRDTRYDALVPLGGDRRMRHRLHR